MKSKSKASKKKKLSSTSQKNWDNFLLVSTYRPFKKQVAEIRHHLGIPKDGFDTREKVSNWNHQKTQQSDEIMDSQDFQNKLQAIRTRFQKEKITKKEAGAESKELHLLLPFNFLTHSIGELAKKFSLPESYREAIRIYIFQNKISFIPGSSFTVGPWDTGDSLTEVRYVPLRIYSKLTDEDLKEVKEEVNRYFGKRLPSFKNIQNVERNVEMQIVATEGELDAVTYKKRKLSSEQIAERFLGNRKKKADIEKIKESLNRTRKNRFGKK